MEDVLQMAISSVHSSEHSYCKFISANDAGKTGGHQSGFYISKSFLPFVFGQAISQGTDYTLNATIKWQNSFETESRFKFYGSKNECHLTRFGKDFPFLTDDNVGDLLILSKVSSDFFEAYVLQTDEDIDTFFAELNISSADTNKVIPKQFEKSTAQILAQCFESYIESLNLLQVEFPSTHALSERARNCYNAAFKIKEDQITKDPDKIILKWLEAEFDLFKTIENDRYRVLIQNPFATVEELINTANTILNRRKSRAGKSLEHHLSEIFTASRLQFESQIFTEDKKRPDFLFPDSKSYLNAAFDTGKLTILAAKTTCKDRWRQILNEGDRIKTKHLFTLQQGISSNQLEEMYKYDVCLVVPKQYLKSFPMNFQQKILSLQDFINIATAKQSTQ